MHAHTFCGHRTSAAATCNQGANLYFSMTVLYNSSRLLNSRLPSSWGVRVEEVGRETDSKQRRDNAMGTIAGVYDLEREVARSLGLQDWLPESVVLSFEDLPYNAPPFTPLLDKAQEIVDDARDKAALAWEEGFAERTQSGAYAWAGPPGLPENRPQHGSPEESSGQVLNWFA